MDATLPLKNTIYFLPRRNRRLLKNKPYESSSQRLIRSHRDKSFLPVTNKNHFISVEANGTVSQRETKNDPRCHSRYTPTDFIPPSIRQRRLDRVTQPVGVSERAGRSLPRKTYYLLYASESDSYAIRAPTHGCGAEILNRYKTTRYLIDSRERGREIAAALSDHRRSRVTARQTGKR